MIVFGSSISPFVRKVLAYCGEKKLEVEIRSVGIGDDNPEYRAASPFGKMPALVDGDFSLSDSSAIIHYLEAKYPQPELIPAGAEQRGRTVWFDEFADTVLFGCGAKIFFNRVVAPKFLNRPGDEAAAQTAEQDELPRILEYLESVVPDAGGFLVGDRLTLADLAVASPFPNLDYVKVDYASRYPRTAAYVRSILERPSFRPSLEREAGFLKKVGVL
jgi:glutathione S-transferase